MSDDAVRPVKARGKALLTLELLAWCATFFGAVVVALLVDWDHRPWAKALSLMLIVVTSAFALRSCTRELAEGGRQISLWRDLRRVALTICITIDALMLMVVTDFMLDRDSLAHLWQPKFEWMVGLGIALGILGSAWAVLAKLEASKAFEEAFESKRYALKTYNSIAGAFRFAEILKSHTEFMLPFHIGRENSELVLFLGFPAVGFFHRGNNPSGTDLLPAALKFCDDLAARLEALKYEDPPPFVRLVMFSKELTKHYLDKGVTEKTISATERKDFEDAEARLHSAVRALGAKNKRFKCAILEKEIGLRFAISKSIDPREEENERAIVWVVADFLTSDGAATPNLSEFGSAGFKSRDPEIIRALRSLCEDYIEHPRDGLIEAFS